jgi:deferrochelatase/peroxidase EfeB
MTTDNGPAPLDKSNVQGLILRGYTHPYSCHILLSFTDKEADTKKFFKTLYHRVQSAEDWGEQKPATMLNIGLTYYGIQTLNVLDSVALGTFPTEFQAGPWSSGSQDSLGDVGGPGDPGNWWCGQFQNNELHCVVHTYALTQADLDEVISFVTVTASECGLSELFALKGNERLTQYEPLGDKIHFGYTDGISEPGLDWPGKPGAPDQGDLNNFLIGYPDGSIIQPGPSNTSTPEAAAAAAFARDGCYNAFRILYQDVAAFNTLLEQQAETYGARIGRSQEDAQEWVAAKLMGRWRNGSPLMLSPDAPDPKTQAGEDFGYVEQDDNSKFHDITSGLKCPFSSHTRVGNPRDEDLLPKEVPASGPPRIVRRGMPYGPILEGTKDDGLDRGLIGLFLCGSITNQFERLYGWFNQNDFSSVFFQTRVRRYVQDAVLGNRNNPNGTNTFLIPMAEGNPITFPQLPDLIVTRGTTYCLLPSLANIRLIAGL